MLAAYAKLGGRRAAEQEFWYDYFDFAFFTGLRPSEQIALKWSSVDMRNSTMRIHEARVLNELKGTKTYAERTVVINDRALAALKRQAARRRLAGKEVWPNPQTGEPFPRSLVPHKVWSKLLAHAGMRQRDMYHTRSTYATSLLMAGFNIALAAKQMGHSKVVFMRIYAVGSRALRSHSGRTRASRRRWVPKWSRNRAPRTMRLMQKGKTGGEIGIRTLDTRKRIPDFESGAFDHSAISPNP